MIADVPHYVWGLLVALLFCSGLFSSSETALFSLTHGQRVQAGRAAQLLLRRPRELLVTILLGNLLVNLLFFAFAGRLLPHDGGIGDLSVGLGALVSILIFGEILPKTLGLRARLGVSRATGPLFVVLCALIGPLAAPLTRALEMFNRLFSAIVPSERAVSTEVLARVMERGAEEGLLLSGERDILTEVIELDDIRVREIMTPRVDALFLERSGQGREGVLARAVKKKQSWLPVIEGDADHVVGRVRVRDLCRRPDRSINELVMPVKFVPEVASALDLLHSLTADRTAEAVVVDEWGGTAGYVTAEDVFEEIVGDLRTEDEARVPAVVPLGEGRYRVAGSLSIRDWNDEFGLNIVPTEFETVGGFVTALLGRIPRAGDVARAGELLLEVHEVRGRRVLTVDLELAQKPASEVALS